MKISLISMYPGINDFGLRTISACLKQAGHDVDLFFLMKEFHKKYSETAMNNLVKLTKGSDLARISVMSNFFDNAIQVTQKLTRKLYLHKFLRNVTRALLPFFQFISQSTRDRQLVCINSVKSSNLGMVKQHTGRMRLTMTI